MRRFAVLLALALAGCRQDRVLTGRTPVWRFVGQSTRDEEWFLYNEEITVTKANTGRVWLERYKASPLNTLKTMADDSLLTPEGPETRKSRVLLEIDCRRSLYRTTGGPAVPTDSLPWLSPAPGSMWRLTVRAYCDRI